MIITTKRFKLGLPVGLLLAFVAEGAACGTLHGYGPLYMRQVLGESHFSVVALSTGLISLATFIMANLWGRWADASNNPVGLARGGLLAATALLLLFPLASNTTVYIIIAVLAAGCLAVTAPVGLAWALAQAPQQPGRQTGLCYQARALGFATSSFVGGVVVHMVGISGYLYILQFVAFVVIMAALALRWVSRWSGAGAAGSVVAEAGQGAGQGAAEPAPVEATAPILKLGSVWQNALVPAIALAVFLSFGSNESFFALLGPYFTEYLGGSPAGLGVALSVAAVIGLLAVGWVGRLADSHQPMVLFRIGVIGYIIVFGLLCLLRQPIAALVLFAVPMQPFIAIGATGLLNQSIPSAHRAEAMGAYEGSAALALAGGSLAAGFGADQFGLAALPLISLGMATAGMVVAFLWVERLGQRPQIDESSKRSKRIYVNR